MVKSLLVFLAVVLLSFGGTLFAEDDFGGDAFEDDSEDSFDDGGDDESDSFDAEKTAKDKENKDEENSQDAMKDLLGDDEEPEAKADDEEDEEDEEDKKDKDDLEDEAPLEDEPKDTTPAKAIKGFKPIMVIKGGMMLMGQYKTRDNPATPTVASTHGFMFGSLDMGIVGLSFNGKYVLSKATLNLRTPNPLTETKASIPVVTNPWVKANYATYDSNFYNWLHEVWGGVNFLGGINQKLVIRAGKMLPTYGLVDQFDSLGAGIGTPYGTRDLVSTEGYIPESDAGWALGFDWAIKKKHHIVFDFMMASGTVGDDKTNKYWFSDKVMGLYIRAGYTSKFLKVFGSLQSRSNQAETGGATPVLKNTSLTGFGLAAKLQDIHGFNMTFSFDYNMIKLITDYGTINARLTSTSNMLIHMMPSYDIGIGKPWLDALQISFRFDLIKGGYEYGTEMKDAYNFAYYTEKSMYMRIGLGVNWYVKEIKGVRSFAGFTFMMQPKSELKKALHPNTYAWNDGFMAIMLTAGAEY